MKIFIEKKIDIFLIFAQNIDCGYMLDEYPQSMFWSKNKKNTGLHTPVLLYESGVQVGFKGVHITRTCFRDVRG